MNHDRSSAEKKTIVVGYSFLAAAFQFTVTDQQQRIFDSLWKLEIGSLMRVNPSISPNPLINRQHLTHSIIVAYKEWKTSHPAISRKDMDTILPPVHDNPIIAVALFV